MIEYKGYLGRVTVDDRVILVKLAFAKANTFTVDDVTGVDFFEPAGAVNGKISIFTPNLAIKVHSVFFLKKQKNLFFELYHTLLESAPIAEKAGATGSIESDTIHCQKCGSTQITSNAKGFGAGKAVLGALTFGGLGLLAGGMGSKKIILTCLKCGKQWKPGQRL